VKEFVAIPLLYRLVGVFVAGALLGYLSDLAAYLLSQRSGRNPWSRQYPDRGKTRWFARLPLVGWLWLIRQRFQLGRGFWLRPLLVELGMGGLCAGLYWWEVGQGRILPPGPVGVGGKIGPSPITWEIMHAVFLAHVLLSCFMLVATLIDFDELIIPDAITVTGTLVGLMLASSYPWTMMPAAVRLSGPGIQFVEFMTLLFPLRSYPDEWPPYLEAPKQSLPLFVSLAVFWFWCLSLLPWLWLPRRGLEKAIRMFIGHAARAANFPAVFMIALCGGAGITMVWSLGGPGWAALVSALAGLAMGGAMIWSVRVIFSAILGKEAMGFGDVTLMAMIGAYLGWQAPVFIFFVAPCIGLVFGLAQLALGFGREIPYGPFLCLATLIVIVAWTWFWDMFLENWFQPWPGLGWNVPPILLVLAFCVLVGWLIAIPVYVARSRYRPQTRTA
jgi:leader peptidase (prepilin peptidase)/N-methyltransferase